MHYNSLVQLSVEVLTKIVPSFTIERMKLVGTVICLGDLAFLSYIQWNLFLGGWRKHEIVC